MQLALPDLTINSAISTPRPHNQLAPPDLTINSAIRANRPDNQLALPDLTINSARHYSTHSDSFEKSDILQARSRPKDPAACRLQQRSVVDLTMSEVATVVG